MFAALAILLPSVFGIKFLDYLNKGLSFKNTIYYYLILVLGSNCFNNILSYLLFKVDNNIFSALNEFPVFFSKFVLTSIVINVLLVFIIIIFQKNIKIEVEVKEKNNVKKKTKKIKKN